MANNCFTEYVIEGDAQFLKRLHKAIDENNNKWVGDIIVATGLMTKEELDECPECKAADLRASWYDAIIEDGGGECYQEHLRFFEDSKWTRSSAMSLIMRLLDKQVEDGIIDENPISDVYFFTEEPGCQIFDIHDEMGKYFNYKVRVYIEDEGEEYFSSDEDALAWINKTTRRSFKTFDEAEQCEDFTISVNEFEQVEEI